MYGYDLFIITTRGSVIWARAVNLVIWLQIELYSFLLVHTIHLNSYPMRMGFAMVLLAPVRFVVTAMVGIFFKFLVPVAIIGILINNDVASYMPLPFTWTDQKLFYAQLTDYARKGAEWVCAHGSPCNKIWSRVAPDDQIILIGSTFLGLIWYATFSFLRCLFKKSIPNTKGHKPISRKNNTSDGEDEEDIDDVFEIDSATPTSSRTPSPFESPAYEIAEIYEGAGMVIYPPGAPTKSRRRTNRRSVRLRLKRVASPTFT